MILDIQPWIGPREQDTFWAELIAAIKLIKELEDAARNVRPLSR
jgi:hypothetical protein